MKVVRGSLDGLKGVPKNGLCIGIHRAGTMHKRVADKLNHPVTIWSLRPDNEFLAYDPHGDRRRHQRGSLKYLHDRGPP